MTSIEEILDRQLRKWELERSIRVAQAAEGAVPRPRPILTVSRQRGSGGTILAERVATRLGYTLLHRDLIDRICASSGTLRHIVASLDEHPKPKASVWFESVLSRSYMDSSDYVKNLLQAIDSIARLGGVVVVGRGANYIIRGNGGFHVRVVAPREVRVQRLRERDGIGQRDAEHKVDQSDRERREFIHQVYGRDIDDPQGYDLVINTGMLSLETATRLVMNAATEKFERLAPQEPAARAIAPVR
jgi:cytidylate kinase